MDPPYYLAGGIFLAVGLGLAGLYFVPTVEGGVETRIGWPAFVISAPFVLIGLLLLTSATTVTLSRETGTLTVRRCHLGFVFRRRDLPLSAVQYAAVGTGDQVRNLNVVLRSGEEISLGAMTGRRGYYQVADAINQFLQGSGIPPATVDKPAR